MLVLVPLGFQAVFMFAFCQLLFDIDKEFDRQYESQNILARLRQAENTITQGLLVLASANLDNQDAPEAEIRKLKAEIRANVQFLEDLKRMRPNLADGISTNQKTAQDAFTLLEKVEVVFGKGSKIPHTDRFKFIRTDSYALFGRSQKELRKLIDSEMQVRMQSPVLVSRTDNTIAALVLAALFTNALIAWWLVKVFTDDLVARLSKTADNARSIAIEKPFAFKIRGTDEVARLNQQLEKAAASLNERRARERAILRTAADAICSIDRAYRVVTVSGAAEKVFLKPAGELAGIPFFDLLSSDLRDQSRSFLEAGFKTGEVASLELNKPTASREITDVRITVRRSVDEKLLVAIFQDISERKQIERVKQQFISMISHDVRTPLASVTSALALIVAGVKGAVPEEAKQAISAAELNSVRLTERIQNILDVERLESGVLVLKREHASLFDAVDEAVFLVKASLAEEDIIVKREFRDFSLTADRFWLAQAFKHLLFGLIASDSHQRSIEIKAEERRGMIDVSIGMPESSHDLYTDRDTELNLSIARTIISKLGGKIILENESSRTAFKLMFERFDAEDGQQ